MTIPPGSTIGIVGGGQLGRMLSIAAARLGYKCHVFDPHESPCAADVAAKFTRAGYDDAAALREFAGQVDVATYEFENLPAGPLEVLGDKLRPGTRSLEIAQDRGREKAFIEQCGARVARWRAVSTIDEVRSAVAELGLPIVLKTRRWGYDGKGQAWIRAEGEIASAWQAIGEEPAVAESGIDFLAEFSVIVARWADGR
ncbi:MAG TPA: ATP-grasp domain-containing protein, partial [Sphingomicrobium sp.]|nr:ATP-grasp domain-containing protein [Sphingomicrobium sp.]